MELTDGSRIAVIGGGPAGSFVSYFLLEMASRIDLEIRVDIYEAKDFSRVGPQGCNHCGGIVSESLVQMLAAEGINLPPSVVQRGIDSYVLHSDVGTVRIDTPLYERRIAAVYRGSGPLGSQLKGWESFDGYLLELAVGTGAQLIQSRVEHLTMVEGKPTIHAKGIEPQSYDLLIGAVGVNSTGLKLFEGLGFAYKAPKTTKTFIAEFHFGEEKIREYLGSSMHVFLLKMPRLEFAALIPKGEYVTLCLLGEDIDKDLVARFLETPEVRCCFPKEWEKLESACQCLPKLNMGAVSTPFTDRVVLIGDSGVTRLFKDGIGAAYRTAKACAVTAIFDGISEKDFRKYYWPACRNLSVDNSIGKVIFLIVTVARNLGFFRKGMLKMVKKEQAGGDVPRDMSLVLWDTFTGSAPYREIFVRTLRPSFLFRLTKNVAGALFTRGKIFSREVSS